MTVRFACEKDIPQMNSLLYQVERVHQQGRPDLFKEGAKKYTDCLLYTSPSPRDCS